MHGPRATPGSGGLLVGNGVTLAAIVLWSTSFLATDRLLETWTPVWLAVGRVLGAGLVLLAFCAATGRLGTLRPRSWPDLVTASVLGFGFAALAIVFGQHWSDPVTTAIIVTSMPLISATMGLIDRTERLSPHLALGIALAIAGGLLASLRPGSWMPAPRGGELLVLASQILWTWYSRISATRLGGLDAIAKSTLGLAVGGLFLLAVAVLLTAAGLAPLEVGLDARSLALLGWLAGFSIATSVSLWLVGVRLLGATVASIHTNLAPFYVMLLALLLGSEPRAGQLVGAAFVVAGAVLAQWPAIRRALAPAPGPA